jgi:Raf kinase inhibitor-like YbhB/YbcL family protein
MKFKILSFDHATWIPDEFCFGNPSPDGKIQFAANKNPHLQWDDFPAGTKSFALICVDKDVPSVGDDVNKDGRTIPITLPRVDFYHWVLVDIPVDVNEILPGTHSNEVKVGGKSSEASPIGIIGLNSYTDFFAGDDNLKGNYFGYDGPCPPWNDERIHLYRFQLYALDVASLNLSGNFTGADAINAMKEHILAVSEWVGIYSLNTNKR